jgi:hypothetical protein
MPYTEYRCRNWIWIYGNPLFTEPVRNAAAAIFGNAITDDDVFRERDPDTRSGLPPIVLSEIVTPQMPPVHLLADVSSRAPELIFELSYDHQDIGRNGCLRFRAGKIVLEWHEEYWTGRLISFETERDALAAQLPRNGAAAVAGGRHHLPPDDPFVTWLSNRAKDYGFPVQAMPDESGRHPVSSLPTLRAVAEELLHRALTVTGTDSGPVNEAITASAYLGSREPVVAWNAYQHVKVLLTKAEQQELEASEPQHLGQHLAPVA